MRVDFYHLQTASSDTVLPVLAEKVFSSGKRLLIKIPVTAQAEHLNTLLWTFRNDSWLPHGVVADGHADSQPVLISSDGQNLNHAEMVMLTDEASLDDVKGFERCLFVFDGNNEAVVAKAREFWKAVAAASDCEAHYWAQNEGGKWIEKAQSKPSSSAD